MKKQSYENARKKERKLCVIILIIKRVHLKKEDNKRKKEKGDNLHDNEKEKLRKYEKKRKENYA